MVDAKHFVCLGGLPQQFPSGSSAARQGEPKKSRLLRRANIAALTVALLLLLPAVGAAEPFAYVGNHFSKTVSLVDIATDSVVTPPVSVGSVPFGLTARPGGGEVWVANHDDGTVSVIQTATQSESHRFSIQGTFARWIAFTPDGVTAYVADPNSNRIRVVDAQTKVLRVGDTIQLAGDLLPTGIAVAPDGARAYVSNQRPSSSDLGKVIVIDTATNTQVGPPIDVGHTPIGIVVAHDGRHVFVTNADDDSVSVIPTASNTVTCTTTVGDYPQGLALANDGQRLYTANYNSSVSVIDISTLNGSSPSCPGEIEQIAMPGPGAHYLAVTPNGRRLYVALHDADRVVIVDLDTNTVIGPGITVSTPMVIAIPRSDVLATWAGTEKVFFTSDRQPAVGSQFHVWMMNTDGSLPQRLTSGDVEDSLPRLSPDGSKLVFQRYDRAVDPNCSNIWILDLRTGSETQVTTPPFHSFSPTWSPNGEEIAFTRGGPACGSSFSTPEIWVVAASDGVPTVLAPFNGPLGSPIWTPDGTSIVYVRGVGGSAQLLQRTPPTLGGTEIDLIPGPGDELSPTYSSAGVRLAWSTNAGQVVVAETADLVGTQSTIVSGGGRPAWSTTNGQLVFDTQESGTFRIWKVDRDGANPTQLTFGPGRDLGPWWGRLAKATQTITFEQLPDKMLGDPPFPVSAVASSGLPVSFSAVGNCSAVGNTVTLTNAGRCTVTASQGGNGQYNAAPDVSRTFAITERITLFLHGTSSTLFLDGLAPTATTPKFRDSASLAFAGGNPWKEIGTWAGSLHGTLTAVGDLRVWLGLRNSDDIGTRFDLRAELVRDGMVVASGETFCITGVTRNPGLAQEVVVALGSPGATNVD
ncbi:MAG: beta-propeller fold lactonase family protein, partial [Gammaproteobacteria bacterium]